jgi:hypothetical protein
MKAEKIRFIVLLVTFATMTLSAAAETIYMPPFTYAGRLMNYMRVSYTTTARIYARNTNGVLLAQAQVFKPSASALNYSLAVPLANTPTAKTAMVGDRLSFEVDDGTVLWVNQQLMPQAPVGNPGGLSIEDIVLAQDFNNNGIDDTYEAMIETLRFMLEEIYEPYNPDADYDGDSVSNRDEYLAGTDPLSAADTFKVAAADILVPAIQIEPTKIAITFYAMRGRTYSVVASDSLSQPNWETISFALSAATDAPTMTRYLSPGAIEEEGMVTFHAVITNPKMFYRLRVQ